MDSLEPNDTLETAATVEPSIISNDPASIRGTWEVNACLGQANEDWYRIEVEQLEFDLSDDYDGHARMRLRGIVDGTGLCSDIPECGEGTLPAAPENTLIVDVYAADSMEHLYTRQDDEGVVQINALGPELDKDILVRVSGPAQALYGYQLLIFIELELGEEVCAC
jgi:hypothetical protein